MINRKFNIVYQITNKINNKIYIGSHQTDKLDDGYMGSGSYLKRAMNKHGIENFERIILENFDTSEEMFKKEKELVTKSFIKRKDTYNITEGGVIGTTGTATVKDKEGNILQVNIDDPRYLSGELIGVTTGRLSVKDKYGNNMMVDVTDSRYLSGELKFIFDEYKNFIVVKDLKLNKFIKISQDEFYNNRNKYAGSWIGKRHNDESKRKIGEANKKQVGEKNSQYGKCWIYNKNLQENKTIKKDFLDEWIQKGWVKGRRMHYKKT